VSNSKRMSIQKISNTSINFTSRIFKNKIVLKTLEGISKHPTSFAAGASLLMSLAVRPLAIYSTPDVEKENKQYAMADSISSGLMKFAIVEAVALPVENAVRKIDENPEKFLKKFTIKHLNQGQNQALSRSYKFITQMIKLGAGFLTAVPKSVLTVALIPVFMDKLFKIRKEKPQHKIMQPQTDTDQPQPAFKSKNIAFGGVHDKLAYGIAKIIDIKPLQNFAIRFQNKDKDIAKHMTAATDILLTATSAYQTSKSNEIKENRKKALIYNKVISTGVTIGALYGIDSIFKHGTDKFIENFKQINAGDPKLHKYVEGINILRPALIAAFVYYGILPVISTYMAEKIDKFLKRN